jgi:arginine decarboxylase
MNTKYKDLIDQTFEWPQEEFQMENDELVFHGIPMMELVKKFGSPLKFTYLPKITENINRAKEWFDKGKQEVGYEGEYHYCYCTKSSHFRYVLEEVLKNKVHLETSSAYDIDLIKRLYTLKKITKDQTIVCNGFKKEEYVQRILELKENGFENIIPVIDNAYELNVFKERATSPLNIGIRIASEEEPKFEFYTSRLGIGYKNITKFYKKVIHDDPNLKLKMLHFFINSGIKDTAYYWNELIKCIKVYVSLKKECPSLDSLNVGGGFPIKNSLAFEYDYQYMIDEIINQVKIACDEAEVDVPNIFTEFGSFTVGESGGAIYQVLYQKQQNDREKWNMIDSSFITTLPDTWAINKRFVMLAVNRWNDTYERVLLGGMTCDSDDYYNSEQNMNAIYLPKYNKEKPLYIGFFNTGAYQETIGGFGGLHHCLIPEPKHLLIDHDENGEIKTTVFSEQQTADDVLKILGYSNK